MRGLIILVNNNHVDTCKHTTPKMIISGMYTFCLGILGSIFKSRTVRNRAINKPYYNTVPVFVCTVSGQNVYVYPSRKHTYIILTPLNPNLMQ